jgi:hypothetical protein
MSWRRGLISCIYIPLGIASALALCLGVDSLIGISSVSFPASVACMLLLFFGLILCDIFLGNRKVRIIVNVLDVPVWL